MSFQYRRVRRFTGVFAIVSILGLAKSAGAQETSSLSAQVEVTATGRYSVPMCDPKVGINCLGRWLLPPEWRPGSPLPERLGGVPMVAAEPGPLATTPMGPPDVLAAYNVPTTAKANGKIVAIIDSPDNHALADVNGYRKKFGIPALSKCSTADGLPTGSGTPCFAQINWDGKPSTNTDPSMNNDGETSLDMDMISAACDDCSILLVESSQYFCPGEILGGVATAIKSGASAVSISLGGPETTDPALAHVDAGSDGALHCPNDASLTSDPAGPYSTPGHLVFVASGDFGFENSNAGFGKIQAASPSYPATSPNVISVGGTTLFKTGAKYAEGVWNDGRYGLFDFGNPSSPTNGLYQDITTSGCSTEFAMPPWQASVLTGTTCKRRATADLSAAAAFNDNGSSAGIGVYQSGQYGGAEGTSASAPLVAALFTRLGLTSAASNDLGWITNHPGGFNDVGSAAYPIPAGGAKGDAKDTSTCGKLCLAGTGWDGPTGVGTPNGAKLAALAEGDGGTGTPPGDGGSGTPPGDGGSGTPPGDGGSGAPPGDAGTGTPRADGGTADATTGGGSGDGGGSDGGGGGSGDGSGCSLAAGPGISTAGLAWLGTIAMTALFVARRRSTRRF
jgi:hypothetical protein